MLEQGHLQTGSCSVRGRGTPDRERDRHGWPASATAIATRGQDEVHASSSNGRQPQTECKNSDLIPAKTRLGVAGLLCRDHCRAFPSTPQSKTSLGVDLNNVSGCRFLYLLDSSALVQNSTEMIHVCASILSNTEILII